MRLLLLFTFIVFLTGGCSKNNQVTLNNFDPIGIDQLDSFSVASYTVKFDSIPTSGNNRMLLGTIKNDITGTIRTKSYIQLDLGSVSTPESKELRLDSVNIVFYLDKYSYGDTTKTQTLYLHELSENIALREIPAYLDQDEKPVFGGSQSLYNISKIGYQTTPLASKSYIPKPHIQDSLSFTLPKSMGEEWFQYILDKDSRFTNSEEFLNYFKGLVLISAPTNQNMVGIRSDSLYLNLHYSYLNETTGLRNEGKISFSPNSSLKYNQIEPLDNLSTLDYLSDQKKSLSSTLTSDITLVQSGLGIVTKITIPYLQYFYDTHPDYAVNHVELRIPAAESNINLLPKQLILFQANKNNVPQSYIYAFNSTSDIQYGSLVRKNAAYDQYYYSFNLTSSINSIRKNEKNGGSLLLSYSTDELFNTLEQLTIQNSSLNKIKLIITYTKL